MTEAKLRAEGIVTIGQLAEAPGHSLEQLLGHAAGEKLSSLASNRDPRRFALARQISGRLPGSPSISIEDRAVGLIWVAWMSRVDAIGSSPADGEMTDRL